jgi:hypothetical protein
MQPQQGMEQQAGMMPESGEEAGNVAPEEQAQYDVFVKNGMRLMYEKATVNQILQNVEENENKVEGLANALVVVVSRLEDSAGESGQEISGDVKLHGGQELLEQMVELVEQAGIHDYTPEEMESAMLLAVENYRMLKQENGTLPVEDIGQDFAELQQADAEGRIDEIAPGASEFAAQRAQQNPEEEQQQPSRGLMR